MRHILSHTACIIKSSKKGGDVNYLKYPNGSPFGIIRAAGDGSIRGYLMNGSLRGIYDPRTDRTFRPNGQFFGYGNLLVILINE